ncbi:MAG TPA: GH25 family lysozyme [Anaerolineales bacterium]|nr:GH25 family lysozyme [Anaerolineales bacterium]
MSYIHGIDVSAYDPYIDWQKVKAQNIYFAIIKATEGNAYFSEKFNDQWVGAKSVGILRGAYHYLRAQIDGTQQADYFLSKVTVQDGDLPPCLDIEETNNQGASNAQFVANAQKWLTRVEQQTGRRPLVYSRVSFLNQSLTINGKAPSWASNYNTWLAQYFYSYSADGGQPADAPGWGTWSFWQYSGDHDKLDGIFQDQAMTKPVLVDLDVYRYSLNELYALAKATPPADTGTGSTSTTTTTTTTTTTPTTTPSTQPTMYTVKSGDTFDSIAQANKITLSQLTAANLQLIPAGTQLNIPAMAAPVSSGVTYTIKAGDNLTAIATKYGVTLDALIKLNNITNPNSISVGQVLQIPKK